MRFLYLPPCLVLIFVPHKRSANSQHVLAAELGIPKSVVHTPSEPFGVTGYLKQQNGTLFIHFLIVCFTYKNGNPLSVDAPV